MVPHPEEDENERYECQELILGWVAVPVPVAVAAVRECSDDYDDDFDDWYDD